MTIWQFANESPWLTFFIVIVLSYYAFLCWNRMMRVLSIRKSGWPPPHCDADGDFRPEKDKEVEK